MGISLIGSKSGKSGEPAGPDRTDEQLKRVLLILGVMAIALGAVYALKGLWPALEWTFNILTPFLVAMVLAYVFNPMVNFIQGRTGRGRIIGVLVVAAGLTALVALVLVVLVIALAQLGDVFAFMSEELPEKVKKLPPRLAGMLSPELQKDITAFLQQIEPKIREIGQNLLPAIGSGTIGVAAGIASGIGAIFSFVSLMVFVTLITFYLLLDFDKIRRIARILIPDQHERRIFYLYGKIDESVGGFLRGQLTACTMVAVLASVFLACLGLKQWAILIGCLAGAVNFIPYLGPATGATPAILWAFFTDSISGGPERLLRAAMILGAFAIIQAIDGFFIQPRIVGKHANLHPLAVLLALLIGARFGVGGMIIAVPTACIVRVLLKELWWDALADQDRRNNPEPS